jgi:nitroreductase
MDIPASRWHRAVDGRRSRRRFDGKPLKTKHLKNLKAVCADFRPFDSARAVLVTESPESVFKGAIGPYGKIRGAPAFIAFVGDTESPIVQEQVGYMGEGIVLEAEALHINTCWVSGTFRRDATAALIGIDESEEILAVSPVGYATPRLSFEEKLMTGFGRTHKRKPLSDLVIGLEQTEWPDWTRAALESARLAPSAVNRQPWRFHIERDSITVAVDSGKLKRESVQSKRLDCGITMLHIEVAAMHHGVKGSWMFFDPPLVARFTVDGKAV